MKFGTSGLRGLVHDLTGLPSRAYVLAFLRYLIATQGNATQVLVGRDLRSSSATIARDCAAAINFAGLSAVDCGELPTPALALASQSLNCPAIMVTGSHIPDDRNGLKFYTQAGEITKEDEAAITREYLRLDGESLAVLVDATAHFLMPLDDPMDQYVQRYVTFFGQQALKGKHIAVYQHSSVARDLLIEVLEALGATVGAFGRSAHFVPVDTEALTSEQMATVAQIAAKGQFSSIVSTDGDGDRPLIGDENGAILRGDVVGVMTAAFLKASRVVTPVTTGSVVDRFAPGALIARTRVGSPYVIEGMEELAVEGALTVGFEANGGFLLGQGAVHHDRSLKALTTRDAILPILAVLSLACETGRSVSQLVGDLDAGFLRADRLQKVPGDKAKHFLLRLQEDETYRNGFFAEVGLVADINALDGLRLMFHDGSIVHFRSSGNAPELRCYVEADTQQKCEDLLAWGMRAARRALQGM